VTDFKSDKDEKISEETILPQKNSLSMKNCKLSMERRGQGYLIYQAIFKA
jgi:hypothetical protein